MNGNISYYQCGVLGKVLNGPCEKPKMKVDLRTHLDAFSVILSADIFDKGDVKNFDETNFGLIAESGRALGFYRTDDVRYAEVVSCEKALSKEFCNKDGGDSREELPFIFFFHKR